MAQLNTNPELLFATFTTGIWALEWFDAVHLVDYLRNWYPKKFSTYLLSGIDPQTFSGVAGVVNPMDGICSVKIFPFNIWKYMDITQEPTPSISTNVPNKTTMQMFNAPVQYWKEGQGGEPGEFVDIQALQVTKGLIPLQVAAFDISPIHSGRLEFLNYEPYTEYSIYLPFIGDVKLPTAEIMGRKIVVRYVVDIMTGSCEAFVQDGGVSGTEVIEENGKIIATGRGSCAYEIPLNGGQSFEYLQKMKSVIASAATGGIAAIATGNRLGLFDSIKEANTIGMETGKTVGAPDGNMGFHSPTKCILTRKERKVIDDGFGNVVDYSKYKGLPCMRNYTIASLYNPLGANPTFAGYTVFDEIHLDSLTEATKQEKEKLESIFKSGVIF